ncbi:MAG: class I SAM-dependent methyltransferase, partial [Actinomycetota bacterium]
MHWFNGLAEHMGPAYLRYSFTKGTAQEVGALIDLLDLRPGDRVLDVGCGPGRHALALAEAGMAVTGIDISPRFIDLARAAAKGIETAGQAEGALAQRDHGVVPPLVEPT